MELYEDTTEFRGMSGPQKAAAGTFAVALILAVLFFIPWRIESSGELEWAPIYRQPIVFESMLENGEMVSTFSYEEGEVDFGVLALQLIAVFVGGIVIFVLASMLEDPFDGEDVATPEDRAAPFE